MKKILIIMVLIGMISPVKSQSFPQEWEGKWSGVVNIWESNHITGSFPMSLEIQAQDSTWSFTLIYDRSQDKLDKREYLLVLVEDSVGHYAIDEKNGIVLDSYINAGCLYTSFGGMGSELLMRVCMVNEQLEYEISSMKTDPIRISGNKPIGNDTIPEIRSYQVYNVMKAMLSKEDE